MMVGSLPTNTGVPMAPFAGLIFVRVLPKNSPPSLATLAYNELSAELKTISLAGIATRRTNADGGRGDGVTLGDGTGLGVGVGVGVGVGDGVGVGVGEGVGIGDGYGVGDALGL
jgi:hypothetical protein